MATLEAIGHRKSFGVELRPFPPGLAGPGLGRLLDDFAELLYHVDCKDTKMRMHNGRSTILGSHLPWADPRRGWDFISTGRGDTQWEDIFRMLNHIGYAGPSSIE